jgi:biopolymer transport protein ExbD
MRYETESVANELPMTPMIDIVFQLLVFFIMTFKIVSLEGDFHLKAPLAVQPSLTESNLDLPPVHVRLEASKNGKLKNIRVADHNFGSDFAKLQAHLLNLSGNESGPSSDEPLVVEIDPDYNLKYENVIAAFTSASGTRNPHSGEVVSLVQNIKLAHPRVLPSEP